MVLCVGVYRQPFNLLSCLFHLQYSAKEDKYEEEIKVLTDKLKEVSSLTILCLCVNIDIRGPDISLCSRLRLVLSLLRDQSPSLRRPLMTLKVRLSFTHSLIQCHFSPWWIVIHSCDCEVFREKTAFASGHKAFSFLFLCHHAVPQTFCPTGFLSASLSVQSHN